MNQWLIFMGYKTIHDEWDLKEIATDVVVTLAAIIVATILYKVMI